MAGGLLPFTLYLDKSASCVLKRPAMLDILCKIDSGLSGRRGAKHLVSHRDVVT